MHKLDGFPIDVGGSTTYPEPRNKSDDESHLAAFSQLLEHSILEQLGQFDGDMKSLSTAIRQAAHSDKIQPYLQTLHAAHLTENMLEVEFSAAGFAGRYIKYLLVDGTHGRYKLRHVAKTANDVTTRHAWQHTQQGTQCLGEALDQHHRILARVTIALENDSGSGLRPYDGDHAIREVEQYACKIARSIAERPPVAVHEERS